MTSLYRVGTCPLSTHRRVRPTTSRRDKDDSSSYTAKRSNTMPRQMPQLAGRFAAAVARAEGIAVAGEIVRSTSPTRSAAYREFRTSRLEALHEMAYLRIFVE